jgi:hypothetical protein
MKLVKATAIVFFLTTGVALIVLSASAQQPTPLPHVPITIPVTPPGGWGAEQWARLRARCQSLADRAAARIPFANRQEMEDAEMCMRLAPLPASATREPSYPQANRAHTRSFRSILRDVRNPED